jgi:hypothetical protein
VLAYIPEEDVITGDAGLCEDTAEESTCGTDEWLGVGEGLRAMSFGAVYLVVSGRFTDDSEAVGGRGEKWEAVGAGEDFIFLP